MRSSPHRNESLDVLRCVAVLLVVGYHLPYYRLWSRIGWVGVDLFFVLSGFLISGLLFQEYKDTGTLNIKRFLIRRGLKIYPGFYLLIAMTAVLSLLNHSAALRTQVAVSAVFGQNYYSGTTYTLLAHTWSLAVEEHFYLLLPLLLMLLIAIRDSREPFRAIPALFAALALLCLSFRCFMLPAQTDAHMTHMRIDSLFAGVALGYLYHFRRSIFDKLAGPYALPLGLALCSPVTLFDERAPGIQTFGLTGLLVGFSFLLAWSLVRTPRTPVGRAVCRVAARVGFYSYSIYLWHTILVDAFEYNPTLSAAKFWTYIATTVLVGIAMAHLVEMPYLALRERRFPPTQSASPAVLSPAEDAELSPVSARLV
jgi:peptidoglycan/LPS O-acetylase OafA/YrhL